MLTNKQFITVDLKLTNAFDDWIKILLTFNDKPKNREHIIDYFFERFIQSPEKFYEFIKYFKKKLGSLKKSEKRRVSKRYLQIISMLCERFGFNEEKGEMDDLCFKISNPNAYIKLHKELEAYQKKSKDTISAILDILQALLRQKGFRCFIKGRHKNIYSIYKKMEKKSKRKIHGLVDIFAFRIVSEKNDINQCFEILNLLHDSFYPVPQYFDDYISVPKVNGYQSLHTGITKILPNLDIPVEIQIRTPEMDNFAEKGLAAHWIYGKRKKTIIPNERERKLSDYFTHLSKANEQENMIYCFSHKGDILKIKRGSTVLDFAGRIHTELPRQTRSALVNGVNKKIHYQIQDGDHIKILLKKE